jgi:hypothetical protein
MHRPSWIWAALPPEARRIACFPDSGQADALSEIGLELAPHGDRGDQGGADAVLVDQAEPDAARKAAEAAAHASTGVAAIAVGADASPSIRPVSRPARALQLITSPATAIAAEATARRLERTMAREGLEVSRIRTGDRSLPRYGLGAGGWLGRRRLPGGAIVIGSTGPRPLSVVEEVVAEATRELGRPLERQSAEVFPSGKLAVELADAEGERYFLSITAGEPAGVTRSEAAIRAILSSNPPASLAERIVSPLAAGQVGSARYVLEPKATGRHPIWISAGLWRQCVRFLADLHGLAGAAGSELPPSWPDLPTAVDILGRKANREDRSLLDRAHREVVTRISGVTVGVGHGDFFTKNLLVGRDSLRAVLDWEWAARDSLPLLDLFDLRAQLGLRRRRGLRVGQNFTDVLWPLARQGGDGPVRSYCEAVGMATDSYLLEGLTIAHWLLRTARLGSINPRRLEDGGWWRANVGAPLAAVGRDALK